MYPQPRTSASATPPENILVHLFFVSKQYNSQGFLKKNKNANDMIDEMDMASLYCDQQNKFITVPSPPEILMYVLTKKTVF